MNKTSALWFATAVSAVSAVGAAIYALSPPSPPPHYVTSRLRCTTDRYPRGSTIVLDHRVLACPTADLRREVDDDPLRLGSVEAYDKGRRSGCRWLSRGTEATVVEVAEDGLHRIKPRPTPADAFCVGAECSREERPLWTRTFDVLNDGEVRPSLLRTPQCLPSDEDER